MSKEKVRKIGRCFIHEDLSLNFCKYFQNPKQSQIPIVQFFYYPQSYQFSLLSRIDLKLQIYMKPRLVNVLSDSLSITFLLND